MSYDGGAEIKSVVLLLIKLLQGYKLLFTCRVIISWYLAPLLAVEEDWFPNETLVETPLHNYRSHAEPTNTIPTYANLQIRATLPHHLPPQFH